MKTTVVASERRSYKGSNTVVASGFVTSIRLPDRQVWERAKEYAREKGMSIGALVVKALEQYMEREDRILSLLEELRTRIKVIEDVIKETEPTQIHVQNERSKVTIMDEGLPSFLFDNPWVEILSRRGKDLEES